MPLQNHPTYLHTLFVTAILVTGGVAHAQTAGPRSGAESAIVDSGRNDPASRWGRGLELSEGGLALSKKSTEGENFIVIQDAQGAPVLEMGTGVDHRMSFGFRGIWSSSAGLGMNEQHAPSSAEDDEKFIYYTMRYDGMRLRLSYFPGMRRGLDSSTEVNEPSNHSGIALGANYDGRIDGFGIGVSAGYTSADAPNDLAMPDMDTWTVGARVDVGGLRVSGGIQLGEDTRDAALQSAPAGWDEAWSLGARYRWGRNDVSLGYAYSENRPGLQAPGDDKRDAAALRYNRMLDGGVEWSINLMWADRDGSTGGDFADTDGTALSTAIRLSF